jgi:sugar phosphate isomerase/epimerase
VAARSLLDELSSDRLKIILDPANIVAGAMDRPPAESLADAFALLGDDIVVAHAKDVDTTGRFCPAGTGIVPWDTYLALIRVPASPAPSYCTR